MDIKARLDAWEWFGHLPAALREEVLRSSQLRQLQSAECAAHRGLAASHWIGVCSGLLKASTSSQDGKAFSDVLASAGEWTGEVEILLDCSRSYDIVALEPSIVILIPASTFRWLVGNDIAFANFAMRHLAIRCASAIRRLERFRNSAGVAAVAEVLIRVMRREGDFISPVVRLSQSEIAEMVCLTRQTVNQDLRLLEARGLVRLGYGRIEIQNEGALRRCVVLDELS